MKREQLEMQRTLAHAILDSAHYCSAGRVPRHRGRLQKFGEPVLKLAMAIGGLFVFAAYFVGHFG